MEELLERYNVNLNELKEKYDLVVFRCSGCADDLKQHNPYVYPDGQPIPLNKIKVIITECTADCENHTDNMHSNPQKMAPIRLYEM